MGWEEELEKESDFRAGFGLYFTMGMIFLVITAGLFWLKLDFMAKSNFIHTTGRIVDYHVAIEVESRKGPTEVYYPIVQYKTKTGQVITFKGVNGSISKDYKIGDIVKVFYNDQGAGIDSFANNWLFLSIMSAITLLFLGLSGYYKICSYIYYRNKKRQDELI